MFENLAAEFPLVPDYRVEVSKSCLLIGLLLLNDRSQPSACLGWLNRAIKLLQPLHEKDPQVVPAKILLRDTYKSRAITHEGLDKYAEAVKDWDRAVELRSRQEQPVPRASRAMSRLKAGMVAEAVAEVAEVAEVRMLAGWNAGQLYNFACVYSAASSKIADKKAEYADAAMELLTKAVKVGYNDSGHLQRDKDLDPLRERGDFKKLLADLAKKFPPRPEVAPAPRPVR